jgi:hypothetical protein
LITIARLSYLVSITKRQQVAQICGFPIYVVTEVAVTPCHSQKDAQESIARTSQELQQHTSDPFADDSDSDGEDVELPGGAVDDVEDPAHAGEGQQPNQASSAGSGRSSVAEDVIGKRGSYGRFAQRWFSKSGWMLDQKRNMGMSNSTNPDPEPVTQEAQVAANALPGAGAEDLDSLGPSTLLPKLLRTAQILFGSSRSFYFSYDYDLTRNMERSGTMAPNVTTPLHTRADPVFFWNRNVIKSFIDAGQDSLVLPLIQGFIGQKSFVMDSHPPQVEDGMKDSVELNTLSPGASLPSSPPTERNRESLELRPSEHTFLITLISRRSTKRAGLRYLRRGIDEDGYVANAVETEQFLSTAPWEPNSKVYSFLQIRGSIPLFFTQTPYSLKPVPVLQHSSESNYIALQKHFERLKDKYGRLQIVNLVEKHGIEATIGEEYRRKVQRLGEESADSGEEVPFEWFDFHHACRGMKFENVSLLLEALQDKLEEFGSSVEKEGKLMVRQSGVLRTNCMDCLDRTNVCQSSFAKYMLEVQLKAEGFDMAAQIDQETSWFNTLWADNGDAVSKQYASTAAMKGDYTRTRKRNYRGTLNDIGLSLTRFYNGYVLSKSIHFQTLFF